MSWFSKLLLGAPWPLSRIERYEVNAEALTLGGLGRGDSRSLIEQRFGPPDSYLSRRRGVYQYRALGVVFYAGKEGKLDGFSVYGPGAGEGFGEFTGRWLPEHLGQGPLVEAELVAIFGEPTGRHDDDPEGPSIEWSLEGVEVYVDFDREGRLSELGVGF